MTSVESAALEWWKSHRPIEWSEAQHLGNPVINTSSDSERKLAIAVARMLRNK